MNSILKLESCFSLNMFLKKTTFKPLVEHRWLSCCSTAPQRFPHSFADCVCVCSNSGEGVGPGETSNAALSVPLQGDRTSGDGQVGLSAGLRGSKRRGTTPTTVLRKLPLACTFTPLVLLPLVPFTVLRLLQSDRNSSSAFSAYAINTVHVCHQEKYLIVSSRLSALVLALTPDS